MNTPSSNSTIGGTSPEISFGDVWEGVQTRSLFKILLTVLSGACARCHEGKSPFAKALIAWLRGVIEAILARKCAVGATAGLLAGILLRVLRQRSSSAKNLTRAFKSMAGRGGFARFVGTHQDAGRDPNDARMLLVSFLVLIFIVFARMRLIPVSNAALYIVDTISPLTRCKPSHEVWWEAAEQLILTHYGRWSALPGKEIANMMRYRTDSTVNPRRLLLHRESRIREKVREEFLRLCDDVTKDKILAPAFAWKK